MRLLAKFLAEKKRRDVAERLAKIDERKRGMFAAQHGMSHGILLTLQCFESFSGNQRGKSSEDC